jgi:Winged helix DNA-binding domain
MLARQLLLERSTASLTRALQSIGGLQTQNAPTGYVGLWSRLRSFHRERLTEALVNREVIQGTLMRSTIHMVSRADYPILLAGVQSSRRDWWQRVAPKEARDLDMTEVAAIVRERLAHEPARAAELKALMSDRGIPAAAWSGLGLWLDMIRIPPSGTWERRRADLYGLADEWIELKRATEAEGTELLVRRYLGGFGPARVADIASWAGLPPAKVLPVVERLRLRRFLDESGRVLFDLLRAPLPPADSHAPVRFLQTFEALTMIHARRTGVMPEQYRPLIFSTKKPQSFPIFLIDGFVAGTWRHEGGRVRVDPFEPVPRTVSQELDEEAVALAAFHSDSPKEG